MTFNLQSSAVVEEGIASDLYGYGCTAPRGLGTGVCEVLLGIQLSPPAFKVPVAKTSV